MTQVIKNTSLLKNAACRLVATQAASPEASSPSFMYQSTKLPNGISVTCLDNNQPVSRVAIGAKAGSRYETSTNRGAAHMIRVMTGMRTNDTTAVTITRHLQQLGARLRCTNTRDVMIYSMECLRENMGEALQYLKEVALQPLFRRWEINENSWRLSHDISLLKRNPEMMLMECLHEAAYRGGLSHSLYSPEYMIGHHTTDMLNNFVKEHFTTNGLSVSGLGINQESLLGFAHSLSAESNPVKTNTAAYRGGEIHRDTGGPFSYVAVCVETPGCKDIKDVFASLVLEQILGRGVHVKYGNGSGSRLGAAAAKLLPDSPHSVGAVNVLYEDSGLFGFALSAPAEKAGQLTKVLADEMKILMGGKLSDGDVSIGKSKVKAEMLCSDEKPLLILEDLLTYPLISKQVLSFPEVMSEIDKVTLKDVTSFARKVFGGKPSMAAVGNISGLLYLDQL